MVTSGFIRTTNLTDPFKTATEQMQLPIENNSHCMVNRSKILHPALLLAAAKVHISINCYQLVIICYISSVDVYLLIIIIYKNTNCTIVHGIQTNLAITHRDAGSSVEKSSTELSARRIAFMPRMQTQFPQKRQFNFITYFLRKLG